MDLVQQLDHVPSQALSTGTSTIRTNTYYSQNQAVNKPSMGLWCQNGDVCDPASQELTLLVISHAYQSFIKTGGSAYIKAWQL
jgi:hypothetical protein